MKQYTYKWSVAPPGKPDAQAVGDWLADMDDRSTTGILKKAKEANSPINGIIEWNESRAALRYREVQIRQIMSRLMVEVKRGGQPTKVIAFMGNANHQYIPSMEARPEELQKYVRDCLYRMASFKRKFSGLAAVRDVVKEMDKAELRAKRLLKKAKARRAA